ncbi:uncharacterized protein LOC130726470 [Lotus japonicus]|uniref:uncharacterized protein LOC130726470 n=1 Tax=Lotus japonicus TaxID=34305 RepID=UPI00258F0422|nr:uncharacterized protein LOC130726470 [Lotus japonicus]
MRKHMFLRIVEAISNTDDYFQMRNDATGRMGLSPLQKQTAAIRMLAYGSSTDSVDEYVCIGESTARKCMARFVKGINEVFGPEYLRKTNNKDIARLMELGKARGFPGMLGSIDCMHWIWENGPTAWKGQYCRGDHGSNNDINVLNQSDVFNDVLQGKAPELENDASTPEVFSGPHPDFATYLQKRAQVREKTVHLHLQADLVEHVWEHFRREDNHN